MFYDILLLEFSRIWFSNSYYLFLKHSFYYFFLKGSFKKIDIFGLLSLFYDIEYNQLWLYKFYEDKAIAFKGYGDIYSLYKFQTKLERISSPSFNSFDFLWGANADLSDLIVLEQSPFLIEYYLYISNKNSFYNY
jgi:hypothetical protein